MKTFKVFSLKVAAELRKQGYRIQEITPNRDKPWLNVYGFDNTEEFRAALERVTNGGKE